MTELVVSDALELTRNWCGLIIILPRPRRTMNNRQYKIKARSLIHFCRVKAISITYSECACLWRIKCTWLVVICGLSQPYFATLSRKLHNFRNNVIDHKVYFHFIYHFRLKHFSFWKQLTRYCDKCKCLYVKFPLFLSYFNGTWSF
jgi:hypothetical protein